MGSGRAALALALAMALESSAALLVACRAGKHGRSERL